MTNDNLDRSIRAIVGDARPTPEAEAAMDDAFAAIAQEAAARSPAPPLRPSTLMLPSSQPIIPSSARITVLLPAPFSPTNPRMQPPGSVRSR